MRALRKSQAQELERQEAEALERGAAGEDEDEE
jgi:hypothetical protein